MLQGSQDPDILILEFARRAEVRGSAMLLKTLTNDSSPGLGLTLRTLASQHLPVPSFVIGSPASSCCPKYYQEST